MNQLKLGARVRYIGTNTPELRGCLGTVIEVSTVVEAKVRWDSFEPTHRVGNPCYVFISNLELVSSDPVTPITFNEEPMV